MASQITALPTAPSRDQTPTVFNTNANAWVAALDTWTTETNTVATEAEADASTASTAATNAGTSETNAAASAATALAAPGTNATSTTSLAIATGSKVFTTQASKSFVTGMYMIASSDAAPSTNFMIGQVTSYSGTTLTLDIDTIGGSGTLADWTITITAQPTVAGQAIDMEDNTLTRPKILDYSEVHNAIGSTGGGTQDIDLELGNVVSATVDTSANTFTFSNPPGGTNGGSFTLILTNGGSQTVNWPASVDFVDGSAPSLTASGVDWLGFVTIDNGTTWLGGALLDVK